MPAPIAARLRCEPALPGELTAALTALPMGVASKFAVGDPRAAVASHAAVDRRLDVVLGRRSGRTAATRSCIAAFAGSDEAHRSLVIDRGQVGPWFARIREMNPDVTSEGRTGRCISGPTTPSRSAPTQRGIASRWSAPRRVCSRARSGRVVFAGEHTAGAHHGTMEGALRSGIRAAEQVAAVLG